jgi:phosphocarrier protein FPr
MLQLESENILMGARADSKEDAIRQVAGILARCGFVQPAYAESMLARERVANTYLGKGVAIPHGRPKDRDLIERTGIAVLQVPGGVAWQPGETAHIVVGIAARSDEHIPSSPKARSPSRPRTPCASSPVSSRARP